MYPRTTVIVHTPISVVDLTDLFVNTFYLLFPRFVYTCTLYYVLCTLTGDP